MGHHHDHSHGGGHHHHGEVRSFNKAFAIAVSVTLAYVIAEVIYGLSAKSMTLLADAAHNLGDVLGLIMAWVANWLLTLPARRRYSYGFKRTTIIAAIFNAVVLVATSALIAYESIYKLFHPVPVDEMIVMIVGAIGIFVNGGSSLLFMRGAQDDLNIKGAFWHLLGDALILVGVVLSGAIMYFTDWQWVDPMVGLIIVAIVLWGTWGLLRDSVHLIMDAVPRYIDHAGVKEYLSQLPRVQAVHDLHIWGLSTREVALTAHLVMPSGGLSDSDYKAINEKLHHDFKISHATIQVESGSTDAPCKPC
jgi:cobalt-zinc-cadmium efflux system protein